MIIEPHAFRSADLIAGNVALDFTNTVTGRNATPRDWLADYASLVEWARLSSAFNARDLNALERAALRDAAGAKVALARATRFREALSSAMYAILNGEPPGLEQQSEIERAYRGAMKVVQFEWTSSGCRLAWTPEDSGLDLIMHVVAVHALSLLANLDAARMRMCAGDNCGWVFLDSSRNGRRRWCDMATCGNVAKARRHYSRARAE